MSNMSDTYYRQRAGRRTRFWIVIAAIVALVICTILAVVNVFRDTCTNSFDRQPRAVVTSFINAVIRGDDTGVIRCWEHNAYYDLEAGCSEICLSRILGTPYQAVELALSEPYTTEAGRANILATVSIACPGSGEQHSGEILLDSVGGNVPWKHWKIVRSAFGGPLSAPWCK